MIVRTLAVSAVALLALAGCSRKGEIDVTRGVGITTVRSACPAAGVPGGTGDVTLFDPAGSQLASAIDVTATITNVRATCNEAGEDIVSTVTFDIQARRTRTDGARQVDLPYFLTVVRGGSQVVAKRINHAVLDFAPGEARAQATGSATAVVQRSAATLPDDIRQQIVRPRKAGAQDAAVDPLSTPEVRQAVLNASFEALVGFQLTQDQLRYNATR